VPNEVDSNASQETKTKILNRIRRLEGQVRGLHKMVAEERNCEDILMLLASIRSALNSAGDVILEAYLEKCQIAAQSGEGDLKRIVAAVRLARG
jgi:DNA-binding FrmR family transcriptional regulator